MGSIACDMRKLAHLRRSSGNLEVIREAVTDLQEHTENASTLLDALSCLRDAVRDFVHAMDEVGDDNPVTDNWTVDAREALAPFVRVLPGDWAFAGEEFAGESDDEDIQGLITEVIELCDEYEDSLSDHECSAGDREEVWGEICTALEAIANALSPAHPMPVAV
jgi:hypothetical protein